MQKASIESQTTPLLHLKTSGNCKVFTRFFISPGRNLSSLLHSSSLHESKSKLLELQYGKSRLVEQFTSNGKSNSSSKAKVILVYFQNVQ